MRPLSARASVKHGRVSGTMADDKGIRAGLPTTTTTTIAVNCKARANWNNRERDGYWVASSRHKARTQGIWPKSFSISILSDPVLPALKNCVANSFAKAPVHMSCECIWKRGLIQWKGGHAKRKEHKKILTAGTDLQGYNGVGVGEGEWQKRNGTGKDG